MKKGKGIALLPIGVFLVLYLGLGILFEYVMEIPMGFYNVPIVVAFLAAILVACLQNRALDFDKKLEIMAQGVPKHGRILLPMHGLLRFVFIMKTEVVRFFIATAQVISAFLTAKPENWKIQYLSVRV